MAKLIIVCVIAMLAVASAAFFEMNNQFDEEAMSCPTNTCVASQGDCLSTATDSRSCGLVTEYMNTTGNGATSCNCRTISQWPALGTTCTKTSVLDSQCGPYQQCAVMAGGKDADYKCYGVKMIGDTCTAGSLECLAPRVCVSGVCAANLAAGATCLNATTYSLLGICPLTQYCPSVYTANQVCTDKVAVGTTCTSDVMCPPYTKCGLLTPAAKTCDRYTYGTVATGSAPTNVGQASCVSYLANLTSNLCVDYDAELAKWNTAFPSPSTVACTTILDCNNNGVYLANCQCTAKATGSTSYCQLLPKPSISAAQTVAARKQGGIIETAYGAGCENSSPIGPEFVTNSAYCASKWSSTFLAAICPSITAQAAVSFSCYDATYGLCNGASALQSSVVMTMIVALVAFFTTQ